MNFHHLSKFLLKTILISQILILEEKTRIGWKRTKLFAIIAMCPYTFSTYFRYHTLMTSPWEHSCLRDHCKPALRKFPRNPCKKETTSDDTCGWSPRVVILAFFIPKENHKWPGQQQSPHNSSTKSHHFCPQAKC